VESEIERLIRESEQLERELIEAQSKIQTHRIRTGAAADRTGGGSRQGDLRGAGEEGPGEGPDKWRRCAR